MLVAKRAVPNVLLVGILLAFSVYRFAAMSTNAAPPGSDGGNWLAFARQLFGNNTKAPGSAYPPLFPLAYGLTARLIDPLLGGKILGVLSSVAPVVPLYTIAARYVPWQFALLGAFLLAATGYHSEVVAFGGYPQLFAEAFALATLGLLIRHESNNSPSPVIAASLFASLTIGTHHLTAFFMAVAVLLLLPAMAFYGAHQGRLLPRLLRFGAISGALSIFYLPTYYAIGHAVAGSPFNVQGWRITTLGETLSYVFRNSVGVWYAIVGIALVGLLTPASPSRRSLQAVAACLLSATTLLFLYSKEVRFLQYIFPGLILGLILAISWLWEAATSVSRLRISILICAVAVAVATAWGGIQYTKQAFPWYQVLDDDRLEALEWLKTNTPRDTLIASTPTRNGLILGWWIEGYVGRSTLVGGDPKWMFFAEEKARTRLANAIFGSLASGDINGWIQARDLGISYLLVDREALRVPPDIDKLAEIVFQNDAVVILKVK